MSDQSDQLNDAITAALRHSAGCLMDIALRHYTDLRSNGYLKVCPFCGDKGQTFGVKMASGGHWYWGCRRTSCDAYIENLKARSVGDTIGFIMEHWKCQRPEAIDKLLDWTGIENPRHQLRLDDTRRKGPRKSHPKPAPEQTPAATDSSAATTGEPSKIREENLDSAIEQIQRDFREKAEAARKGPQPGEEEEENTAEEEEEEEAPAPAEFSLSDLEEDNALTEKSPSPGIWHRLWETLNLNPSHREELKRKRGYSSETIDRNGYRSAQRNNQRIVQGFIAREDETTLLAEGIAVKDTQDKLVPNSQLCGYGLVKRGKGSEAPEWGWTDPILIPYFNRFGQVIYIRPHKGGISNKKWSLENRYERAFKANHTRVHPYTSLLFWNRPADFAKRCVLTEGEFKVGALDQCNIPAIATPGIQMLVNKAFLETLINTLHEAGITEVIVVYDNEDKSHKPDPLDRYDSAVYARYACHMLRANGFYTRYGDLPDEWRDEHLKADWDGALVKLTAEKKNPSRLFRDFLNDGTKPYYPQGELFGPSDERERIIYCKMNRLLQVPVIRAGGDEEEDLAKLILGTKGKYRMLFQVREMAAELFATRGCYYVPKKLKEESLREYRKLRDEIKKTLDSTPRDDFDRITELECALAAADHFLKGRPEILSDFTIECDFQLRTQSGETHKLFRFKNKHGQISDQVAIPPESQATSVKFRTFASGIGNYNSMLGDKHIQALMIQLGSNSAWREIRELNMLGQDPESKLWIFGDCAFTPDGKVIFPDNQDIIWHDGIGYRVEPAALRQFSHKTPPKMFDYPNRKPDEILAEILADPEKEKALVARVFLQLSVDLICTFGGSGGLLILATILGYAVAPEMLAEFKGQPGVWIHGRLSAGKTQTVQFLMGLWGFPSDYQTVMMDKGSTNVGLERALNQYCNIPVHLDEFRHKEADDQRIALLRGAYGRQSKQKGLHDQTNRTRSMQPMTSPIVSGEGVTSDSATLSRFIEVILSKDARLGTSEQQIRRLTRMLEQAEDHHRIVRWLLMNRKWFATTVIAGTKEFITDKQFPEKAHSRLRTNYGAAYMIFKKLFDTFERTLAESVAAGDTSQIEQIDRQDLILLKKHEEELIPFMIQAISQASADVTSVNFVVKFWDDVMNAWGRNFDQIKRFIKFAYCSVNPDNNQIRVLATNMPVDGGVRCVLVLPGLLYAEYEREIRSRNKSPDLTLANIRAETMNENYWIPGPTNVANRSHRGPHFDGMGQQTFWGLRMDRMDPVLLEKFESAFEITMSNSDKKQQVASW